VKLTQRRVAAVLVVAISCAGALVAADKKAEKKKSKHAAAGVPQMDESKRAVHALNRLTFGPRPGEAERVAQLGVEHWFEEQLHPEKISDAAIEARLTGFRTLKMDARQMVEMFPAPPMLQAIAQGRMGLPSDPERRAIYETALARYQQQKAGNAQGNNGNNAADVLAPGVPPDQLTEEQRQQRRELRRQAMADAQRIAALPAEQRMPAIIKLSPQERRVMLTAMSPDERQQFAAQFTPEQRETLLALAAPQAVVPNELQQAKLLRAAYSERQLQEVMTDFWFNHFNVFMNKGADRYLLTDYERDVIRAHALGKFEDLLLATAKSPAMLFYLDNWQSVGPNSQFAGRGPRANARRQKNASVFARRARGQRSNPANDEFARYGQQKDPLGQPQMQPNVPPRIPQNRRAGLNENYGRELMELHTLGVDGGYTQKDVTEVAKVFTGWTIRQPRQGGDFEFNARMHEPGKKHVLGHEIKEGGEGEGRQVLELLARHPATARFISRKLAMRFVSDNPPEALVERMAKTFEKSDGDIREVLRTMFKAPEFWAAEAYRAKVKTPLEFVVSAIRATGADVQNAMPLVQALNQMGMPLYQMQPPTGYSMKAEAWVNSSALLARMNFALRLSAGRLPGIAVDAQRVAPSLPAEPSAALPALEDLLLAGDVSRQTHETIQKQMGDPTALAPLNSLTGAPEMPRPVAASSQPQPAAVIAGLILGSPEFQRR
jgi:uncharacterized protein (DUF1800 family)